MGSPFSRDRHCARVGGRIPRKRRSTAGHHFADHLPGDAGGSGAPLITSQSWQSTHRRPLHHPVSAAGELERIPAPAAIGKDCYHLSVMLARPTNRSHSTTLTILDYPRLQSTCSLLQNLLEQMPL